MQIRKLVIYAIAFGFVFSTAAFGAGDEVRDSQAMTTGLNQNFRASDLMNKDLHNAQGKKIGEVNDLVIDENGQVQQIVIGDSVVPFDSSNFFVKDDAIIAYNLDGEMLGETDSDRGSEDARVRGYYDEGVTDAPGRTIEDEDDRALGYPLDRHPQLDVWFPPAGHPPYGAGD